MKTKSAISHLLSSIGLFLLAALNAGAGSALVPLLDASQNPLAGVKCIVVMESFPQPAGAGVAVLTRTNYTTDAAGQFLITNCVPGVVSVQPVGHNYAPFEFLMPATNGTIRAQDFLWYNTPPVVTVTNYLVINSTNLLIVTNLMVVNSTNFITATNTLPAYLAAGVIVASYPIVSATSTNGYGQTNYSLSLLGSSVTVTSLYSVPFSVAVSATTNGVQVGTNYLAGVTVTNAGTASANGVYTTAGNNTALVGYCSYATRPTNSAGPLPVVTFGSGKNSVSVHEVSSNGWYSALDSTAIVVDPGVTASVFCDASVWNVAGITCLGGATNPAALYVYSQTNSGTMYIRGNSAESHYPTNLSAALPPIFYLVNTNAGITANLNTGGGLLGVMYAPGGFNLTNPPATQWATNAFYPVGGYLQNTNGYYFGQLSTYNFSQTNFDIFRYTNSLPFPVLPTYYSSNSLASGWTIGPLDDGVAPVPVIQSQNSTNANVIYSTNLVFAADLNFHYNLLTYTNGVLATNSIQ